MVQLQVLNKILATKDSSLLELNKLTDEYFCDYKQEFGFIKGHFDTYGVIPDGVTFASKFPDFTFIEVQETDRYLIKSLFEDHNKRKLAATFNKVKELVTNGKTDDAIALYVNAAQDMTEATALECVDIFKDVSRYDKYVEKIDNFDKYYVKTGFPELDEVIGGWDRKEELGTIVARPGVGKSWVLLKCAIAAAEQGLVVGLYSGEMSENKVGWRADTLIEHISNGKLIHGDVSIQNDYKKYVDELPTRFKGTIKVITPKTLGGNATVTALRAFIKKENLDMLCIDQHSLMEDERNGRSPVEKAANISKDLKKLQVLAQIPIIAVSQQNRESTDSGATTANVAQSDRISQDSTAIIFLEQKDSILTLDLVKSRDSVNGKKLKYAIDLNMGIFKFMPNENDATQGKDCVDMQHEFEGVTDGNNEF